MISIRSIVWSARASSVSLRISPVSRLTRHFRALWSTSGISEISFSVKVSNAPIVAVWNSAVICSRSFSICCPRANTEYTPHSMRMISRSSSMTNSVATRETALISDERKVPDSEIPTIIGDPSLAPISVSGCSRSTTASA